MGYGGWFVFFFFVLINTVAMATIAIIVRAAIV